MYSPPTEILKIANFPTLGPKGPQKPPKFTYNPKCWQHKSNKICTFPQQKSSKLQSFMSSHFHFHNDRKLSSNTTNSSLPNQARLTICFQLPGSCLSFKLWKNATTVTSPHFPFHDDRRLRRSGNFCLTRAGRQIRFLRSVGINLKCITINLLFVIL